MGSSLSRFNFKERLMSPEGASGLVSPTGASSAGVQEVIQLLQQRKVSGGGLGLSGLGSPNNGQATLTKSTLFTRNTQLFPMDSEKSVKKEKDVQFLMKMNTGENKLGFQKSLAEVLR